MVKKKQEVVVKKYSVVKTFKKLLQDSVIYGFPQLLALFLQTSWADWKLGALVSLVVKWLVDWQKHKS